MSRRSRRRSSRRQSSFLRRIVVVAAVLLVVMLVGIFAAFFWVRSYMRSDAFRVTMEESIGRSFGGDVALEQMDWVGLQTTIGGLETTTDRSPLSLSAESGSAEVGIGGVLRGVWHVPQVTIRALDVAYAGGEIVPDPKPEPDGFFAKVLPSEVDIDLVTIENLNVAYTGGDSSPLQLRDTQVVATANDDIDGYDIIFRGGEVLSQYPLLQGLELRHAEAKQRVGSFHLQESEWSLLNGAVLTAAMTADYARSYWAVDGVLSDVALEKMLDDTWSKRARGQLSSVFQVSGSAGQAVTTGSISIANGSLTALPVLDRLAAYVDSARFRQIVFDRADCSFRYVGERVELTEIYLNSAGMLRLTGSVAVEGEQIDGTLRLGVVPGLLARIPGAESAIFTERRDGLLWTTIFLDGTLDSIKEDLSNRLFDAARERMFQLLPASGKVALKHSGIAVDEATETLLEQISILGDADLSLIEKMRASATNSGSLIDIGEGALRGVLEDLPASGLLPAVPGIDLLPSLAPRPEPEPIPEPEEPTE